MLREAAYYGRMGLGVYRLLRKPPVSDAEELIRRQLENRQTSFLDTVRRVVFANPENPYHRMFRLAGCCYEDLEKAVNRDGLEATLASIHREGVYLTHDEFKGKVPIIRSGRHILSDEKDFLNPLVSGLIEGSTSGSRSIGIRTRDNTENQVYREAKYVLIDREFQLAERARIAVWEILPSVTGLSSCLRASRSGRGTERWFAAARSMRHSPHYRLVTTFLVLEAKLLGARVPFPTYLPPNDFSPVAEWIARRRAEGVSYVVGCAVSPAVRVAAAAVDKGLDIGGTLFQVGGEALTAAKRAVIEAAGAEVAPFYFINELGPIGHACRRMKTGNCVHLYRDSVAVINHRRLAPLSDTEVDSLLFTTLLPFAPRVLINVEMDDSGVVEPARCDCVFTAAGFREQIRDISSFGKLTGMGITLVGTDVVRALEAALPARFGGRPGDYQLLECEGASQTQLVLRVSPRVGLADAAAVKDYFLKEIRRFQGGAPASLVLRHVEGLEVIFAEPLTTQTGKVLSLHLLGTENRDTYAS